MARKRRYMLVRRQTLKGSLNANLWIIAVKYTHLKRLLAQIKQVDAPLLFIQMGLTFVARRRNQFLAPCFRND